MARLGVFISAAHGYYGIAIGGEISNGFKNCILLGFTTVDPACLARGCHDVRGGCLRAILVNPVM